MRVTNRGLIEVAIVEELLNALSSEDISEMYDSGLIDMDNNFTQELWDKVQKTSDVELTQWLADIIRRGSDVA